MASALPGFVASNMIAADFGSSRGLPPLWVFLHVPKCGGTTLQAHLENHFVMDEGFVNFSNWGRQYRLLRNRREFADRPAKERIKARVLSGHQTYFGIDALVPEPRDVRYFTVVRDPAERCVSLYNFRRSRGKAAGSFHDWYEAYYEPQHRDYMVTHFARSLVGIDLPQSPAQRLALAKILLEKCWFVTSTDAWDAGLALVSDDMGIAHDWRNYRRADQAIPLPSSHPDRRERLHRHFTLDDETRARVYADSAMDLKLYRWVKANRWPREK